MDYLKFLGLTLLGVGFFLIAGKLFGPFVVLAAAAATLGVLWRLAPARYSAGYALWLLVLLIWSLGTNRLLHTDKAHSPEAIQIAVGFWVLVGAILWHPVCYALGRLAVSRWQKRSSRAVA